MQQGLIHIYTGKGKGKTTCSAGLAIRALGQGLKVCYASFHKRPDKFGFGELHILRQAGARVLHYTQGHQGRDKRLSHEILSKEVHEALIELEDLLASEQIDLLVIDEILISVRDHYITEERLLEFIERKPEPLELVLTGRGATERLIQRADYVTEMSLIKHPFQCGIPSRRGIEY